MTFPWVVGGVVFVQQRGSSVQAQPTLMSNNSQSGTTVCGIQQLNSVDHIKGPGLLQMYESGACSSVNQQGKGNDYEMIFGGLME